jgi:hypothetical protein
MHLGHKGRALCAPLFSLPRHLQRRSMSDDVRDLYQWKVELWARNGRSNLAYNHDFHGNCRDFLHAVKLRHGTDGFTSPPKKGMLRIFSPEKSDSFGPVWTRELGYQRRTLSYSIVSCLLPDFSCHMFKQLFICRQNLAIPTSAAKIGNNRHCFITPATSQVNTSSSIHLNSKDWAGILKLSLWLSHVKLINFSNSYELMKEANTRMSFNQFA